MPDFFVTRIPRETISKQTNNTGNASDHQQRENVFYVHYYESDSSGGELPLMRISAENEDESQP